MGFLSPQVVSKFRDVIKQTTDTFLQKDIVYKAKSKTVNRFGEDENTLYTDYNLKSMYVQENNTSDMVIQKNIGTYDESDGYFLFNFDDLNALNLIANGQPTFNANIDTIICDGLEYEVMGVHPLGQFVDTFTMVKVVTKKRIQSL